MKKWKPSKSKINQFKNKMSEIEKFCETNNIISSKNNDSYYFTVNDINYRVSNHTIESSNLAAFDNVNGFQKRNLYHNENRDPNTVYIHAGKTRIIDIYNDIISGYKLDSKGNRINW